MSDLWKMYQGLQTLWNLGKDGAIAGYESALWDLISLKVWADGSGSIEVPVKDPDEWEDVHVLVSWDSLSKGVEEVEGLIEYYERLEANKSD